MSGGTCQGCGAALRGRQWICKPCLDAAERAFRTEHKPTDPDWIWSRNAVFGDRAAFLAAVAAGRAMAAA